VVLLHGLGADGYDLIDLAPGWGQAVPEAAFVAPHAPEPCDIAPYGRHWFSVGDRTPARMRAGAEVAAACARADQQQPISRVGRAQQSAPIIVASVLARGETVDKARPTGDRPGSPAPSPAGERVSVDPIRSANIDPTTRGLWIGRFRQADSPAAQRRVLERFQAEVLSPAGVA
jgi:hypothetical protein